MARSRWAVLPWLAVPFALHVAILVRFWYNAPVMDDFDSILQSMVILSGIPEPGRWLSALVSLHNEHRAATTRLIPIVFAKVTGSVDFRLLMLMGPIFMLGCLWFIWDEFRERVSLPIAMAGGFLVFQWSYSEALLHSSGTLPHLGVMFFSIAGLYFALRPGWTSVAACVAFGVLAVFSQANGLVMLPVAAAGCFLFGMRRRALFLAAVAAALWIFYFTGYKHPPHHPPVSVALKSPLQTFRLYLVNIGGVVPLLGVSQFVGACILAAAGWVTWKGIWRRHPTAFLWIVFVLLSAAAVTSGRAGWGIFRADRYAVNPALLMPILLFSFYSLTGPWGRPRTWVAVAAAAGMSFTMTYGSLPLVRDMSLKGKMLADLGPSAAALGVPRWVGAMYPHPTYPLTVLESSEKLGFFQARRETLHPTQVVAAPAKPPVERAAGSVRLESVEGSTLKYQAWTDIPPTAAARKVTIYPADGIRAVALERLEVRDDVARAWRRPDLLVSGFRFTVQFESPQQAREAALTLCVAVEAPGQPGAVLERANGGCR